ncbi:MAG: AAA family ATPase [Actinomycetota bacterium]|nr:AAA family ATPase [Actinomycetota bacterium]
MSNILNNSNNSENYSSFKIIVADTELDIFSETAKIKDNFCFINLSSEYAVNFVLEYEKIDILFISKNISNFENILERAKNKKIKSFLIEKDLPKKFDYKNLKKIIMREFDIKKSKEEENNSIQKMFKRALKKNLKTKVNNVEKKKKEIKLRSNNEKIKIENVIKDKNFNVKDNDNSSLIKNVNRKNRKNEVHQNKEIVKAVKQKVITVFRAKGGVGATTVSFFIANLLNNIKTLIIDLNFNEGCSDLGYYLNTPKTPNLTFFSESYDKNSFQNCLISLDNNVDIILPPPSHEISDKIDLKEIYTLVELARKKYDLMIFDLPNKINEFYLGITDISDTLLILSDESIGSLGRITEIVKKYIYDGLKKVLIINKIKNQSNIKKSIEVIRSYLKPDYLMMIPYSEELDNQEDLKKSYFNNLEGFNNLKEITLKILTS